VSAPSAASHINPNPSYANHHGMLSQDIPFYGQLRSHRPAKFCELPARYADIVNRRSARLGGQVFAPDLPEYLFESGDDRLNARDRLDAEERASSRAMLDKRQKGLSA